MAYTLDQYKKGLAAAQRLGDTGAVMELAALIRDAEQDTGLQINPEGLVPAAPSPDASIGENIVGAGEAALAAGTAIPGAIVGGVTGGLTTLAQEILAGRFGTNQAADAVERAASQGAAQGAQVTVYTPRTAVGASQLKAVGDVAAQLPAVIPAAGPLRGLATITKSGAAATKDLVPSIAAQAVTATAKIIPAPVKELAGKLTQVIAKTTAGLRKKPPADTAATAVPGAPSLGAPKNAGAAGVDPAVERQARASQLDVPIPLTKAMRTREAEDVQFEFNTKKDPELGAPLRERDEQINAALLSNMDALIADLPQATKALDQYGLGVTVDKAVRRRKDIDDARAKALYEKADEVGETRLPAEIPSAVKYLNENYDSAVTAPSLDAIRSKALRLGIARKDAAGNLVPVSAPLKQVELFRQVINEETGTDSREIRHAARLKELVDTDTENAGGDVYKRARAASARGNRDYVNSVVVKQLLSNKPGTDDRSVAYEAVLDRLILAPSVGTDSVKHLQRTLYTAGSEGVKAWYAIQAGALQKIRDAATKTVATDATGEKIVSPAALEKIINDLDRSGKLTLIFGARKADKLRLIKEVAVEAKTIPPNLVNTSGTASALTAMMDFVLVASTGIPVPLMAATKLTIKELKTMKVARQVKEALAPPPTP